MAKKDIIVIGGSAGCHSPLRQILSDLPPDLPASVFIATHVPTHTPGYLSEVLEMTSSLPVTRAVDGQAIERGCVYVAVPDHHLLVIDGTVRLGNGPRENLTRPAIDPLFRSAALSYGPRVVGLILSGMLNDGASGLKAIKACGGTAVVQHPLDADADQMPLSALEVVEPDRIAAASDIGQLLVEIVSEDAGRTPQGPEDLALEVEIAGRGEVGRRKSSQNRRPKRAELSRLPGGPLRSARGAAASLSLPDRTRLHG